MVSHPIARIRVSGACSAGKEMCVAKSAQGSTYGGSVENYFHCLYQWLEALVGIISRRNLTSHINWNKFYSTLLIVLLCVQLEWEDGAGEIYMNGTAYILKQCHWHSPSEHTIDGRR